ncbi:MAG: hypothetical protein L3J11_02945 [Draconibacterium sp.]|nr:hypothetical protein [Draconibacterium sp.]
MTGIDEVILCGNQAKNVAIAIAIARLFNAVSVQKNKPEWSYYFVTIPKASLHLKKVKISSKKIYFIKFDSFLADTM